MKKILFISSSLESGGAERQMVTLAVLLKNKGYDVSFLCYNKKEFYAHILVDNGIPIIWLSEANSIQIVLKYRQIIRSKKYDVVISFLEIPNFINNFAKIGGGTWKTITGERSSHLYTFKSIRGRFLGFMQRFSDYIVCNSNNAEKLWEKYYSQYISKLKVIYNCILLQDITSKYIFKKDLKLHIVIVASYQYLKNSLNVIKSINKMSLIERNSIHIDWYGRIEVSLGNTSCYDESVALIKEYDLSKWIILHGDTKDIHNIMNEADVIALFSKEEGLPNVICEGMLLGKPIIMTKVSDFNVLVDESNGVLCDWDDIDSIKDSILYMTNLDFQQMSIMGKASKLKAEKLFSKNKTLFNWVDLIES